MAVPTTLTTTQIDALLQTSFGAALDPKYGAVNLGSGSPMAALLKAVRDLGFILQDQVQSVGASDHLPTAVGSDIDSFVQPFGITRLPGNYATTTALLGTNSPVTAPVQIPPGLIVQRATDGVQYVVVADTTQPGYAGGVYTIATGQNSVAASVVCLSAGTLGNCAIGAINSIFTGVGAPVVSAVSTVTNAAAVTNGIDQESDAALYARFQIQGGQPKYGVRAAILSAVASVQSGLIYQYGDIKNPDGSYHAAYFTVVVNVANSGTGTPPSLIAAVKPAVDAVRSGGVEFTVVGPSLVAATVTGTITVAAGYVTTNVEAAAKAAIQSYINGIGMNADGSNTTLSYAKVNAVLLAVPGVANISSVLVNGATADLTAGFAQQFVASGSTVFGP